MTDPGKRREMPNREVPPAQKENKPFFEADISNQEGRKVGEYPNEVAELMKKAEEAIPERIQGG